MADKAAPWPVRALDAWDSAFSPTDPNQAPGYAPQKFTPGPATGGMKLPSWATANPKKAPSYTPPKFTPGPAMGPREVPSWGLANPNANMGSMSSGNSIGPAGGAMMAARELPGILGKGLTKVGIMGFAPPAGTPQQQGQAMAPKPAQAASAPSPALAPAAPSPGEAHPLAHAFGQVMGRAFGGPSEEERTMEHLRSLPDRPGVASGAGPGGFRNVGIAQAQVPQGGFANSGDPGHQLHPLLSNALSNPAASMVPQYTSQTFDRVPGLDYDPYPALAGALGHPRSLPATPMFGESHVGPSGPSQADVAMQALHAQAGLTHAQGQAEMAHGQAQHYLGEAADPTGMNRLTPEGLRNAERMQSARTGIPVMHTPWESYPAIGAAVANPNFNVGVLMRALPASGVDPNSPQGRQMIEQILSMKGINPEEEYQAHGPGRSPLNGLEYNPEGLFPRFKQYQSPESQQIQQFLQPFRR